MRWSRKRLVGLQRWLRYRFVVPIVRSRHPPDYTARGVAVGVFWALTPTFGVQMALVLLNWVAFRQIDRRWDFNALHAMAWTWLTNFATVIPAYYTFYVTGQLALGRWDDLSGYDSFARLWDASFPDQTTGDYLSDEIGAIWTYFEAIVEGWGLAMFVGFWPYAILGAWIGHAWSLRLVVAHRRRLTRRRSANPSSRRRGDRGSTTADCRTG